MGKERIIIVGQGLAGSCLALELLRRGLEPLVVDHSETNTASMVAAGLFNPVTSRVKTSTWMAEVLFPYLHEFYRSHESLLKENFYHPKPMYRPFTEISDQEGWSVQNHPFVSSIHFSSKYGSFVKDSFGGIVLKNSGYVDTAAFVLTVRRYLKSLGLYVEHSLDLKSSSIDDVLLTLNAAGSRIIFCEGVRIATNPWFNWLPISSLKGETAQVETNLPDDIIFNRGVYLVPFNGPGMFKVGATYDRSQVAGNSVKGLEELSKKTDALINVPFRVTGQSWGFRPVVTDRRPILGLHPEKKNLVVFNGLGTKGVTLAPWFASCLADWLEGKDTLPFEVNISRFYPLYFKYLHKAP